MGFKTCAAGDSGEVVDVKKETSGIGSDASHEPGQRYKVEWDAILRMAWRQRIGTKEQKEYSLVPEIEENEDGEILVAAFPDGMVWIVPDVSVEQWKEWQSRRRTKEQNCLWDAVHTVTGEELMIAQRVDRNLYLSLYKAGCQVLAVQPKMFGTFNQTPVVRLENDNPAIVGVLETLVKIAERFRMDELKEWDLKGTRDAALQNLGLISTGSSSKQTQPRGMKRGANSQEVDQACVGIGDIPELQSELDFNELNQLCQELARLCAFLVVRCARVKL